MKGCSAMKKVLQFLKDSSTFYIATADSSGKPHVRPFGAVAEIEGRLCIATNNQKEVYKQMITNPFIEISGMAGSRWIRLSAEAVRDDRREARVAMLEKEPGLAAMYKADDGIFEVFYLKNASASICSFTEAPETITF